MDSSLLRGLSEEQRRSVLQRMVRRSYRKGDTVFHAGDPGETLHVLVKGHVAVRITTRTGDVATFSVLGPGEIFGEQALLSPEAIRTASIVALEPVETMTLHRRDFDQLRADDPRVDRVLIEVLSAQVRRLSGQVMEALYDPADRRVVRRLSELAEQYGAGGDDEVVVPLTQDDLATMAGTTRPTANRVLQGLVERGLVVLSRGKITVTGRAQLRKLAG